MQNFSQLGEIVALTAPSGGVVSGSPYKIGSLVVVATVDADQTESFSAAITGVYSLPKVTGVAWTEGAAVYWDNSASKFTTSVISDTGDCLVGVATADAGSSAATGYVRLDGVAR